MNVITAAPLDIDNRMALYGYVAILKQLVTHLERRAWHHDDPHVGPVAPLLAQARADLDAAQMAARAW